MIKKIYKKLKSLYLPYKHHRQYWKEWNYRINDVLSSKDNKHIPRVINAGKIVNNYQVMHNGLKIVTGSYYGNGITQMLKQNKGVHEPQEERVFQEVLKILKGDAVIIELGAYWSFYSMWFLTQIKYGKAFLYEPELKNLEYGVANFKLNSLSGDFNQAFIGREYVGGVIPQFSVDYIIKNKGIEFVDVLHCDIQGYEFEMLIGAKKTIEEKRIGYFFISTHSNEIHHNCLSYLTANGFAIISDFNLNDTCSVDGLIVARAIGYEGMTNLDLQALK